MIAPFPEIFFRLSREKNYASLRRLFRLLNIRYIYHNSAHNIYDNIFPQFPYTYARLSLPDTQAGMTEMVQKLGAKKIFSLKSYDIYELSDFLPIVYVPTSVVFYQNSINDWYGQTASFFINDTSVQLRQVYADQKIAVYLINVYVRQMYTYCRKPSRKLRLSESIQHVTESAFQASRVRFC